MSTRKAAQSPSVNTVVACASQEQPMPNVTVVTRKKIIMLEMSLAESMVKESVVACMASAAAAR